MTAPRLSIEAIVCPLRGGRGHDAWSCDSVLPGANCMQAASAQDSWAPRVAFVKLDQPNPTAERELLKRGGRQGCRLQSNGEEIQSPGSSAVALPAPCIRRGSWLSGGFNKHCIREVYVFVLLHVFAEGAAALLVHRRLQLQLLTTLGCKGPPKVTSCPNPCLRPDQPYPNQPKHILVQPLSKTTQPAQP